MEGLLATLLAGQQQPSQPTAPPLQPPAVEPAGSSATSPNLLAFDAGQAYARACHEYASATKAYQLAQQAQQAQEQIAAWWTAAAKNHPPATEKEPATPAVDISQFVKEAVDARITEQWQKDEKQVAHFKSVQEQGKPSLAGLGHLEERLCFVGTPADKTTTIQNAASNASEGAIFGPETLHCFLMHGDVFDHEDVQDELQVVTDRENKMTTGGNRYRKLQAMPRYRLGDEVQDSVVDAGQHVLDLVGESIPARSAAGHGSRGLRFFLLRGGRREHLRLAVANLGLRGLAFELALEQVLIFVLRILSRLAAWTAGGCWHMGGVSIIILIFGFIIISRERQLLGSRRGEVGIWPLLPLANLLLCAFFFEVLALLEIGHALQVVFCLLRVRDKRLQACLKQEHPTTKPRTQQLFCTCASR